MDLQTFLAWVVPAGENKSVCYMALDWTPPDRDRPLIVHRVCETTRDLANSLKWREENRPANLFFACASYHPTPIPEGKRYPVALRKATNIAYLKALWCDIDCKGDEDTYASKKDALRALSKLVQDTDLPKPSILVDSGNGIHAYWCFEEAMTLAEWQPRADALRAFFVQHGLLIDKGITIDGARILRAPETTNRKDALNPKDVRVLSHTVQYPAEAFDFLPPASAHIDMAPGILDASQMPEAFRAAMAEDDIGLGDVGKPQGAFHMEHIATRCAQMRQAAETRGARHREPMWKATLLLAAACEDGAEWAHTLSRGHGDYQVQMVEDKLAEQRQKLLDNVAGPTRCATFDIENPGVCGDCPLWGSIKSPIVLGRRLDTLPPGYMVQNGDTYRQVSEVQEDGSVETETHFCFAGRIEEGAYGEDEHGRPYIAGLYRERTFQRRVVIDMEKIRRSASQAGAYLGSMCIALDEAEVPKMRKFLNTWEKQLREAQSTTGGAITAMGWANKMTAFDVGDTRLTIAGERPVPSTVRDISRLFTQRGDIAHWHAAIDEICKQGPQLQALVALSFAAPLAAMIGLNGFLFAFHSAATGVGKSTALRLGASVWGDPLRITHSLGDTPKSVLYKIGHAPNLPVYWDEFRLSKQDRKQGTAQTKLLFQLAEGREMSRLNADVKLQGQGRWQTIMAVATNEDMIGLLNDTNTSPEPVYARMLQIDVPSLPEGTATHNEVLRKGAEQHSNVWRPYMAYVLEHRKQVEETLEKCRQRFRADTKGVAASRYWIDACACLLAAAGIANAAKLARFDTQGIYTMLKNVMRHQSFEVHEVQTDYTDVVGQFRAHFLRMQKHWVITHIDGDPDARILCRSDDGMIFHIDMAAKEITLTVREFAMICDKMEFSKNDVLRRAGKAMWKAHRTPGAGTPFGGKNARSRCVVTTLDFLGVADSVENFIRDRAEVMRI